MSVNYEYGYEVYELIMTLAHSCEHFSAQSYFDQKMVDHPMTIENLLNKVCL